MTQFEHGGKDYDLRLTRAGLRSAEAQGFVTSDLDQKPTTALYWLFFASLFSDYKLSPKRAFETLDDLLDDGVVDFTELFEELTGAYSDLFGLGETATKKSTRKTPAKPTSD